MHSDCNSPRVCGLTCNQCCHGNSTIGMKFCQCYQRTLTFFSQLILSSKVRYTLFANNDETNFLAKKCVSAKPIHEQRTAFYILFVIHRLLRQKLFHCQPTTNILFQFCQKTASSPLHTIREQ